MVPRRFDIDYPAELQKIRDCKVHGFKVFSDVRSIFAVSIKISYNML